MSITPTVSHAAFFFVGPGMPYTRPSEVAQIAADGDVIEIEAGTYAGDVAVWRQNNLTIRGVGGYARLPAQGNAAEDKAIWVIKGDNTLVENIHFEGAAVEDGNGAGIRQEGTNLTVRNCRFVRNENGILSGTNPRSEIIIENSEFDNNGAGDGYTHNLYIGEVRRFVMRFSYSHHAHVGHQIKTRAATNEILYNRLMDENDGDASYIVDIANGGDAHLVGNLIQQGPNAENWALISYAAEFKPGTGELVILNNTLVNERGSGIFVVNHDAGVEALLLNNVFSGTGSVVEGRAQLHGNLVTAKQAGFRDSRGYDYRLTADSQAIGRGVDPSEVGVQRKAEFEYRHLNNMAPRTGVGPIDAGAHQFSKP
ncbi:MAG: right-handed parallel beta-helix repeat-containing protein [Gammaproteobacteria bacterium]|nr:right-handed parallel beta-helix repeat-containing protein [Gammaproteobacteria bacterium]